MKTGSSTALITRRAGPAGREAGLERASGGRGALRVSPAAPTPKNAISKAAPQNGSRFAHLAAASVPVSVPQSAATRAAEFILGAGTRRTAAAPKLKPAATFDTAKAAADFVLKAGAR